MNEGSKLIFLAKICLRCNGDYSKIFLNGSRFLQSELLGCLNNFQELAYKPSPSSFGSSIVRKRTSSAVDCVVCIIPSSECELNFVG